VLAHDDAASPGAAARMIDRVFAALDAPLPAFAPPSAVPVEITANGTPEEYMARVSRARELIAEGDCIQIVLAQRFDVQPAPDPLALYRALRHVNPSPYMFLLETTSATLVGASPEPFVRVEGGKVVMHPIAGTRPRGSNEAEDAANEAELRGSEKERAEHVMLVDLGRNDLGRVCEYGSVAVDELMEIESYSHVMHIVSSVSGTLRPDVGAMDALRSVLPAGTLSGAPKVRAMQIIDELEPLKRGGYGGAIGYLSYAGDLDTAIHIRTVVVKDGVAHVQAGGGTVADAKPDYEYRESVAKARGVMDAIELAVAQDDWP